jgi:hypothetical protein
MGSHHTFNLCLAYERKIKEKKVKENKMRRIKNYIKRYDCFSVA